MNLKYLETRDIVFIHEYILKNFGGLSGIKDYNQLDSMLFHIQNDKYYPTLIEKSCHLFFGIIKFHCFNDGNKRTAITVLESFLRLNGIDIKDIIIKLEDIAVGVAENNISKEDLSKIIKSMFISFGYKF